jgi:phage repressor protein C with HTH and peptisase S24 domain
MEASYSISAKRFKIIREENRYTQQAFASLLQIGNSTIDIERGKTKISGNVVAQLVKLFNINPLWLYGESDQKYLAPSKTDVSPKVLSVNQNNEDAILLVNQKASAGYPQNIHDTSFYKNLPAFNLPLPQYRNATYRAFQVEGDSMMPNIRSGDWVLGRAVTTFEDASDNKVHIVVLQDSVLVKKLKKTVNSNIVRLVSFNTSYPDLEIPTSKIQELWQVNSRLTFGVEEPIESNLLKELQQSMQDLKMQIKTLQA